MENDIKSAISLNTQDAEFLSRTLELASEWRGFCAPNPAVGVIVVKDGEILAEASHPGPGQAHAEVLALKEAGQAVRGATLYVSLEPCCHWGKTPPCSTQIIESGIARVVYGLKDPNPQVAGGGVKCLNDANIAIVQLELPEVREFYRSYCYWHQHHQPLVTLKLAMSLDGKIAGPQGKPIQLTGESAKEFTHLQRLQSDAILTTVNTIQNDDPKLNVRRQKEWLAKPVIVLDSQLNSSESAQIFTTAAPVVFLHAAGANPSKREAFIEKGATCVEIASHDNGLDLEHVLAHLGEMGVHDCWVEAGGQLAESLLSLRLVQRAYFYIAAKILGGTALPAFTMEQDFVRSASEIKWHSLGEDVMCQIDWPISLPL